MGNKRPTIATTKRGTMNFISCRNGYSYYSSRKRDDLKAAVVVFVCMTIALIILLIWWN